jgi:probable rRNA maturation factor
MKKVNFNVSSRYGVNRKKLRLKAEEILAEHGLDQVQLDVWIVGKRKIKELNETHLKHEGATDVLSFPQHEKHQLNDFPLPEGELIHLGEVVISFPEAVERAKRYGKMVDDQLSFYLEHGLMHLLGYHHQ